MDSADRLLGIITNRDLRFVPVAEWATTKVDEVMTPMPLITGPVGISRDEATLLLRKHKRERLPLVDAEGRLGGLITVKDFVKSEQFPHASKDSDGRLMVGAAIGYFGDSWERATTWSRLVSTYSSPTPRTATSACCSTWSAGSRPTRPPSTCR